MGAAIDATIVKEIFFIFQNTLPAYSAYGYLSSNSFHCTKMASARPQRYRIVPVRESVFVLHMLSTNATLTEGCPRRNQGNTLLARHKGKHVPGPLQSSYFEEAVRSVSTIA